MKKLKGKQFMEAMVEEAVKRHKSGVCRFDHWSYWSGVYKAIKELGHQGFLTKGQVEWLNWQFLSYFYLTHTKIAESAPADQSKALSR